MVHIHQNTHVCSYWGCYSHNVTDDYPWWWESEEFLLPSLYWHRWKPTYRSKAQNLVTDIILHSIPCICQLWWTKMVTDFLDTLSLKNWKQSVSVWMWMDSLTTMLATDYVAVASLGNPPLTVQDHPVINMESLWGEWIETAGPYSCPHQDVRHIDQPTHNVNTSK